MAYGGMMGQTPLGGAPFNGLPTNDVRELTVRSGYDISAGDVVDVEGGEVFKTATTKPITTSTNTLNSIIDFISKDKAVMYDLKEGYLTINVSDISKFQSGTTPTVLKTLDIPSTASNKNPKSVLITKMGKGRYVVSFHDNTTYGDRSWFEVNIDQFDNITYTQLGLLENFTTFNMSFQLKVNDNTIIFNGENSNDKSVYMSLKISEKKFTQLSSNSIEDGVAFIIPLRNNMFVMGTNKIGNHQDIVLYKYTETSFNSIDSHDLSEYSEPTYAVPFGENKIAVAYRRGGMGYPTLQVYSYTDSSLTFITEKELNIGPNPSGSWGNSTVGLNKLGDNIVLMLSEPENLCSIIEKIEISDDGKTIQELNRTEVFTWEDKINDQPEKFTIYTINNNTMLCQSSGIQAGSGSNENSAIIILYNNQFVGEVLDTSKTAIALQSASSNQPISVGFGGYCECPNITQGQMITSSGVMGYGVQDGWLDIRPSYGKDYVIGSYVGDGTNNRKINIGFTPRSISIYRVGEMGSNSSDLPLSTNEKGFVYQGNIIIQCVNNGFIVSHFDTYYSKNESDNSYGYIAFR